MNKHAPSVVPEELQTAPPPGQELEIYNPGADAGLGMENIGKDEYAIPFLSVLDAKSPQCAPPSAGGTVGARAGSLYNSATNELFDGEKGTLFIPVHRDHHYVEWIPKNEDGSGGGFVGIRSEDDPLVLELRAKFGQFGKLLTHERGDPNCHELIETFYIYGMTVAEGVGSPVLVPFKSTGISAYKNFITRVMAIQYASKDANGRDVMIRPPLWAHKWLLGSQYRPPKKANQAGWYIPKLWLLEEPPIKSRLKMTEPLYLQSREYYESIKAGRVVIKQETQQQTVDADIPF